MSKYIIRLDDASEKMDIKKWTRMEQILLKNNVNPLVGVIPNCADPMMENYEYDSHFWEKVNVWLGYGWTIALHGFNHVYCTTDGGVNPVNLRSEFAGLSLEEQKAKIRFGVTKFRENGINPLVFFAPSHTFDANTVVALKEESDIRIISDTVANKPYTKWGITFVPQQSGRVRRLPFSVVTFCYHPNTMTDDEFELLSSFLERYKDKFIDFPLEETKRKKSILDTILERIYFLRRGKK